MRKFIVSDLHGDGIIYDTIMTYLENISEDVELFINGDLIDWGVDSFRMLLDVENRIKNDSLKIHYLGGDHELMLYQALLEGEKKKQISLSSNWIKNGGFSFEKELNSYISCEENYQELKSFLGNLKIYHVFHESIYQRPILLVHAQAPKNVCLSKPLRTMDNNLDVYDSTFRGLDQMDKNFFLRGSRGMMRHYKVGHPLYFVIKGHIPVRNEAGFFYHPTEHYIDIDGGCSFYAKGDTSYDAIPLVEVEEDKISFFILNHNHEIKKGYILEDGLISPMEEIKDNLVWEKDNVLSKHI